MQKNNDNSRIVLGTAQLGLPYGISNKTGKPDYETSKRIIEFALNSGINIFDTAQAYGDSEKIIGKILQQNNSLKEPLIITKLNPGINPLNKKEIVKAFNKSFNNLKCEKLYGYMLHREDLLDLWNKGLGTILCELKQKGYIEHIGISVYSPEKAIKAINTKEISLIQIPGNILDRRFENINFFNLAEEQNKIVFIRSIYLQGLILMHSREIPSHMQFVKPLIQDIEKIAEENQLNKKEMGLLFVKSVYKNAKIILGVERLEQLKENILIWHKKIPSGLSNKIQSYFSSVDEKILNPALWPRV